MSVKLQVQQEKNSLSATGAPVGSLGEPQEDGGHWDLLQEMFLLVNTLQSEESWLSFARNIHTVE